MERFQMLQNLCQIGILLSVIIGGFCTYGTSYFSRKKEELKKAIETPKIDSLHNFNNTYNINGDYVANKKQEKVENHPINAPNALIVTKDQKGGQNTVNVYGGKPNPANSDNKPIFAHKGNYGYNILNFEITSIEKETGYSFLASIPDNSKLKVTLSKLGDDKTSLWGMDLFSNKNWRHGPYKNGEQQYDLDEISGELKIVFRETGSAKLNIYFNDTLINSKIFKWN